MIFFVLGLAAAYLFLAWTMASQYLSPSRIVAGVPTEPRIESLGLPSSHGPIPTWITRNIETAPAVFVLAYGYGGSRTSWEDFMRRLSENGLAAIAPSMPGQDESPDRVVGFGLKEADTVELAVKWVREHCHQKPKIILLGVSMGGSACWLASDLTPLVDGIITEGAYAEFPDAVKQMFDGKVRFGHILFAPVVWLAETRSGIRSSDVMPVRIAKKWKGRPALIIQAEDDNLILRPQAEELVKATGADYWLVPNAQHANCYWTEQAEYMRRVLAFTHKLLGQHAVEKR